MNEQQLLQLMRQLAQRSAPLAAMLGGNGFGQGFGALGGLLGLGGGISGGNIPGALGGALGAGRNIASLLDQPGVATGLGALSGPLGIGTNLAAGNLGGAASALPGAVGSGASALGSMGAIPAELAASISSSLGAIAGPAALAYMIAGTDTHGDDFFDNLFGNRRDRMREYKGAQKDLPISWGKWLNAASALPEIEQATDPADIARLFKQATEGIRAQEFSPAYELITKGQGSKNPGLHDNPKPYVAGRPLPELEAAAPLVTGKAWQAWVKALDKAENSGVDWRSMVGGNRQGAQTGLTETSEGQPVEDYQRQGMNIDINNPSSNPTWEWTTGDSSRTTQEAYDLSQAIYGAAMAQGRPIDGPLPGAKGGGGYLAPDQLKEMGFTPGNYEKAIQNYLDNLSTYEPAVIPKVESVHPVYAPDASGGE